MFNVSGGELLIILFVALVVLGPQKLPEAARQVGKVVGEFRRMSAGFQREMKAAMDDPLSKVTGEPTPSIGDVTNFTPLPAVDDAAPKEPPAEKLGGAYGRTTADSAATDSASTDSTSHDAGEPEEIQADSDEADDSPSIAAESDEDDDGTPDVPMYGDR